MGRRTRTGAGTGTDLDPGVETTRALADDSRMNGQPIVVMYSGPAQESQAAREPCRTSRPVTHSYSVLTFYDSGAATIEQRGSWSLQAGDVLLVPAGEPHRHTERREPGIWALGLCGSCLVADGAGALTEPFDRVRAGEPPVVRIPPERRAFLVSLFSELAAELGRSEARSVAVQRSLVTLILAEVERAASWKPRLDSPDSLVAACLRFIEQNCLRRLSLRDVAAAVHRSPAHVTTALKRATGRSAVEWIIAGRLAAARHRLLHSDEQIEIIGERVGYTDPTHFIRLFRRAHGMTPAAWRAKHRGAPQPGGQ